MRIEAERMQKIQEREDKEAEKERQLEEKAKKEEEERQKKEEEEYEKWKQFLVLEEQGTELDAEKDEANLLQKFITYVQQSKIIEIERLALMFKLGQKDTIKRLKDLQEQGMI